MSSFISTVPQENRICKCGKPATAGHHKVRRHKGGQDGDGNIEPICAACHTAEHSTSGEFATWGRWGGKETAKNPLNWMRNLRQFRSWSDDKFEAYCRNRLSTVGAWGTVN